MYQKIKRLLALLAVIIILLLYLAAFILSLFHNEKTEELLMISLVATVVIPVLLYIYLWLFRLFQKKAEKINKDWQIFFLPHILHYKILRRKQL